METDPRHVNEVIKSLELETAKAAARPCAASRNEEKNQEKDCDQKCEGEDATTHRAVVARMNYISLDRPDVGYAITRACGSGGQ
eukprot:11779548-Heterocapsa_arctica.AAC.1